MEEYDYKISALVLVYKREKNLRFCLDSLINQTLSDLELILIDNGCSEDNSNICLEYERIYNNINIINQDEDQDFETSINLGLKSAKGEYIILINENCIIPNYAFEKLYNSAKNNCADICIGSINHLIGKYQYELHDYERNVWEKERIIEDIKEFPILFHDTFYWNKIIKKNILVDNNLEISMAVDYASRNFIHTSYTYAKLISIIPDCVVIQKKVNEKIFSDIKKQSEDYMRLLKSYNSDLSYFKDYYNDYIKILMKEFIKPIKKDIMKIEEIDSAFYSIGYNFFKKNLKLNHILDNDLTIIENIYFYFILNKIPLENVFKLRLIMAKEILDENNKSYWKLPLFRSFEINIPDELFEIHSLETNFLNIKNITTTEDSIIFNGIQLPKYFSIKKGQILLYGRTPYNEILRDNILFFDVESIDEENNVFYLEINKQDLMHYEIYDVYFKAELKNGLSNKIRISERYIKSVSNTDELSFFSTKNRNLSLKRTFLANKFEIICNSDEVKVIVKNPEEIKKSLKIYLRNSLTGEKFYLKQEDTYYNIKWKFFLDKNSVYNFYLSLFSEDKKLNKNIKLNSEFLTNFEKSNFKNNENVEIEVYKTKYNNIRLRSSK